MFNSFKSFIRWITCRKARPTSADILHSLSSEEWDALSKIIIDIYKNTPKDKTKRIVLNAIEKFVSEKRNEKSV